MVWLPKTEKVGKKWKKNFYGLEKDVWLEKYFENDIWIKNNLKATFGLKVKFGWKMIWKWCLVWKSFENELLVKRDLKMMFWNKKGLKV